MCETSVRLDWDVAETSVNRAEEVPHHPRCNGGGRRLVEETDGAGPDAQAAGCIRGTACGGIEDGEIGLPHHGHDHDAAALIAA